MSEAFVIPGINSEESTQVVAFGDGESTLFTLPVLGSKGVPMGLVTGAMMLSRAFSVTGPERSDELGRAWAFFIDVLATSHPNATRYIASLDFENVEHVMNHWFAKSRELGGFDPKASPSLSS